MINFIDLKRRWEYLGLSNLDIVKTFQPLIARLPNILYFSCCALVAPGCINKTGFVLGLLMMFGSMAWS